jgi:hypothetical protein
LLGFTPETAVKGIQDTRFPGPYIAERQIEHLAYSGILCVGFLEIEFDEITRLFIKLIQAGLQDSLLFFIQEVIDLLGRFYQGIVGIFCAALTVFFLDKREIFVLGGNKQITEYIDMISQQSAFNPVINLQESLMGTLFGIFIIGPHGNNKVVNKPGHNIPDDTGEFIAVFIPDRRDEITVINRLLFYDRASRHEDWLGTVSSDQTMHYRMMYKLAAVSV